MQRNELRDCDAWRKQNLPLSTSSNEAAKLYDCALSQIVKWYDDKTVGGIETSLNKMLEADPSFVLGYCLKYGAELIGTSFGPNTKPYESHLKQLTHLVNQQSDNLTEREIGHFKAISCLYNGNPQKACDYWERLLIKHPTDIMAIKFAHDCYFYMGYHAQMRDSLSRVLPIWNASLPLYSSLHGMHSFGLVQTNYFAQAVTAANKALELNKYDAWATHTLCHYYEYVNDFDLGIKYLRETETNWSICDLISPHNYWHLSLYHIERNEHEIALDIYDENISAYLNQNRVYDMVDLASFLFRLKLDGCVSSLDDRWSKLNEVFESRAEDHGYVFNDSHVMMILSACKNQNKKQSFFSSLNEFLQTENESNDEVLVDSCNNIVKKTNDNKNYLKSLNRKYANALFESIGYFDQGEYSKVVDNLYPIRYELINIGGSNAQRDLFHQLLTQAALRSDCKIQNKLGLKLINERLSLKPNSNLTKRIAARFASKHEFS